MPLPKPDRLCGASRIATGPNRLPTTEAAPSAALSLGKVEVLVNVASGSVGPNAPDQMSRLLEEFGVSAKVRAPAPENIGDELRACVDAAPDLLIVLAGDGTARAAAELCGPDGPMIAPLPGGTMNMLPHAVYGQRAWPDALRHALEDGTPTDLGGGCVAGHRFLCAAILGSPARLASAREAARKGKPALAFAKMRHAMRRAFTGRLRYQLDGGQRDKAESLVLICPIASKVMSADEPALEAAALNVRGAGEVLRLGLNALVRDWRVDPAVDHQHTRLARVWSAQGIPAILDGETVSLPSLAEIRYDPKVCRVLMPPREAR